MRYRPARARGLRHDETDPIRSGDSLSPACLPDRHFAGDAGACRQKKTRHERALRGPADWSILTIHGNRFGAGMMAAAGQTPIGPVAAIGLGVLLLASGVCGAVFLCLVLADWAAHDAGLRNFEFGFGQFVIGLASALLLGSIAGLGAFLRFLSPSPRPAISLALALLATLVVILFHVMMSQTLSPTDHVSRILLAMASLTGLAIAALPPCLHWRSTRRTAAEKEH